MRLAAILAAACPAMTAFSLPETPVELKTEVTGTRVDLTWANGDAGSTLLECGFEDQEFPPAGWSTIVTNNYAYLCSWFQYPTEADTQAANYKDYIHRGEKSALMYFDVYFMQGDHESAQDEWLITAPVSGASYLEAYYYIDPTILEYGAYEDFPDHYYVKTSYDNGQTWDILWDARNDASPILGWHSLTLPLKSDSPVMVAFQGVSDIDETIHFLWALDDIRFCSSRTGSNTVEGYTIMLDGNKIAEHVKSLEYTDRIVKEPGTHRYEVFAESNGTLSPAAATEVTIDEIKLLPPANLSVETIYDDIAESYTVSLKWDTPQGKIPPSYYNVYADGTLVATMLEENEIAYTGYTEGIYEFQVTAAYTDPDGESEKVGQRVAIDTRFNAHNLQANAENGTVTLTWDAPEPSDYEMSHYEIWRSDANLSNEVKGSEFVDAAPAGNYRYYVTAVYADGFKAMDATIDVTNGEPVPHNLPFAENFDSGHLPADWTIVNFYDFTPDNLLWQFDDPQGLQISGEGFDKGFASIDCSDTGFYALQGALTTPAINVEGCDADKLTLSYSYDFASNGLATAKLEYEQNNNETWLPLDDIASYAPDAESPAYSPKTVTYNLADIVSGASSIRFRWNYNGVMDLHLAIDNVKVANTDSGVADTLADTIKVSTAQGAIFVQAADGVDNVEVYTAEGRLISSVNAGGSASMAIPVDTDGMVIVKVTTPSGSRTVKVMM